VPATARKYSTKAKQALFDFREGLLKTAPSTSSTPSAGAIGSSGLAAGRYVLVKFKTKNESRSIALA